jgi:aspartate racemase
MEDKSVGIMGGMGPEATVDLMLRVIQATPAKDDADHIRMIVDNDPKLPSRIKALLEGTGESPAPYLADMARRLESWGADFLAIPCNTAHYYYEDVQSAVGIPVLNMIELTTSRVVGDNPGIRRVGLLAATAVLKTGLYSKSLGRHGVTDVYPSADLQDRLMVVIRTVKTGRYGQKETDVLGAVANYLVAQGAQALVIACTELSLIGKTVDSEVRLYDASQVLAETIVQKAKNSETHSSSAEPARF